MTNRTHVVVALTIAAAGQAIAQPTEILVDKDYMSSGFFQSDYLRGEEVGSSRVSSRVSSPTIFGVTGETTYFGFDFDPSQFSGPVPSAVFRVETINNSFFGNPDPSNPADISVHSLSADPLAVVDQSLASGAGSWIDFRDNEITAGSVVSTTSVDGLGVFEWDITALVNEWIANGSTNFAYTIGTSALLDPEGDAAVAFVNSTYSGLTGSELTARISIIPAPAPGLLFASAGLIAFRRRG